MSTTLLHGDRSFNIKSVKQVLHWFARQDEQTLLSIISDKQKKLKVTHGLTSSDKAFEELLALLQAIIESGYADELAFKTSKSISIESAKQISLRRKNRATQYQSRRVQNKEWVVKNLGKIAEFRRAGLSWRRVAVAIHVEHGIKISYTTLIKYWEEAHDKLF